MSDSDNFRGSTSAPVDREIGLSALLAALPVPEPGTSFVASILTRAREARTRKIRRERLLTAAAAAIVTAASFGLVAFWSDTVAPGLLAAVVALPGAGARALHLTAELAGALVPLGEALATTVRATGPSIWSGLASIIPVYACSAATIATLAVTARRRSRNGLRSFAL